MYYYSYSIIAQSSYTKSNQLPQSMVPISVKPWWCIFYYVMGYIIIIRASYRHTVWSPQQKKKVSVASWNHFLVYIHYL